MTDHYNELLVCHCDAMAEQTTMLSLQIIKLSNTLYVNLYRGSIHLGPTSYMVKVLV